MSSRSDAGNIVINTASSGRRKNVACNEKDGVTHNGAGVHPSSAAPDAKSTVAPMMVENDSPPSGDQSNTSIFPKNSNSSFMPPFQAPNAPTADPFAYLLDYDNPLAPSTAPARNDNKHDGDEDDGDEHDGDEDDGDEAGDDDVTVRTARTPQLDDSKSNGSHRSNASRHSVASYHLLPSMFKICNNDNTVYVPETGGLICPTPKCNYLLCTACGDAAHRKQKTVLCPNCKSALKYDVEAKEAEADQNADIDISSLIPAYQQALSVLGKKLPKYISHTKLGLRKLKDAIILANSTLQEAEEELKAAQSASENAHIISRLTLERDNAGIALRQAKLNEPYITILQQYLEVQDMCKKAEKDFDKMRRNTENEQKLRLKIAMANIAAQDAQDAAKADNIGALLMEQERRKEERDAYRRKRDAERYQARKQRLRQSLLSVPPAGS